MSDKNEHLHLEKNNKHGRQFYEPWYNDKTDYNTNAPSYYDYLARFNDFLQEVEFKINDLLDRDIDFQDTKTIDFTQKGDWQDNDTVAKLYADLIISRDELKEAYYNISKSRFTIPNAIQSKDNGVWAPDYSEVFKAIDQKIKDIENRIYINIKNSLDRIDYQRCIGTIPERGVDGISFIQGIAIVQEKNELYVLRKDNELAKSNIERYDLETLESKDNHDIKQNSSTSYNEGLPYKINDRGQVIFVIRTNYDQNAYIYNYDENYISKDFILPGSSKQGSDYNKTYYFTNFGDATDVFGVYLYEFNSVFEMKPELIRVVRFDPSVIYDYKIQSISMVNDCFVLFQGKNNPKITVLNLSGDVVSTKGFDKYDLKEMFNQDIGDTGLRGTEVGYEAEGSDVLMGSDDNQYLVVTHMMTQTHKAYITIVGEKEGTKIGTNDHSRGLYNPNWIDIENFGPDVEPYSNHWAEKPKFMIDKSGFIHLRGVLTYPERDKTGDNTEWTEMNKHLFNLPYPYFTYTNQHFRTLAGGNPEKSNRIEVTYDKENRKSVVILTSTSDDASKPFCVLDGITIFTDNRLEWTDEAGDI